MKVFAMDPPMVVCPLSATKPGDLIVFDGDRVGIVLPAPVIFDVGHNFAVLTVNEAGQLLEMFNNVAKYKGPYFFRGESDCVVAAAAIQTPVGSLVIDQDQSTYVAYKDGNGRPRLASLDKGGSWDAASIFNVAYFERWSIVVTSDHGEKVIRTLSCVKGPANE